MPIWSGIDYGTKRIGLAISDGRARIAMPATTLAAAGSPAGDVRLILKWATSQEVAGFVVGLPLNMDGTDSDQTRITRAFADTLRAATPLPVELWDERLSSFQADQHLAAADLPRARRAALRDALAAQVILQSYLDAQQAPPADESPTA